MKGVSHKGLFGGSEEEESLRPTPWLLYDLPPAQLASVFVCTASALFQSFELFRGRRPSPSSVSPAFFATNLIEGQGT